MIIIVIRIHIYIYTGRFWFWCGKQGRWQPSIEKCVLRLRPWCTHPGCWRERCRQIDLAIDLGYACSTGNLFIGDGNHGISGGTS